MMIMMQPRGWSLSRLSSVLSYHSFTALRRDSESASSALECVIYDDDVGATTGQHATDRSRHAGALLGRCEIMDRLAIREPCRKELPVPCACHDAAAVTGEFVGEVLAVAGADD